MATGTRPVWGDGRTDPIHLDDDEPRLDPELFDPSVRDRLRRVLRARRCTASPAERFDTADADARRPGGPCSPPPPARPRPPTRTGLPTRRRSSGSPTRRDADTPGGRARPLRRGDQRARAARRRHRRASCSSTRPMEWNRAAGVGLRVRREILDADRPAARPLRRRADAATPAASIDRLAASARPQADHRRRRRPTRAALALAARPARRRTPAPAARR